MSSSLLQFFELGVTIRDHAGGPRCRPYKKFKDSCLP